MRFRAIVKPAGLACPNHLENQRPPWRGCHEENIVLEAPMGDPSEGEFLRPPQRIDIGLQPIAVVGGYRLPLFQRLFGEAAGYEKSSEIASGERDNILDGRMNSIDPSPLVDGQPCSRRGRPVCAGPFRSSVAVGALLHHSRLDL